MLTIKSDDVYGRSKAYESIIKKTKIVGPKVPESFNVLVKELQGLGLKVDLVQSDAVIDAETVLAENVKDEAKHQAEVEVPAPTISDIDVTQDAVRDEFLLMDDMVEETAATTSATDNQQEEEVA
jgi:hypothetical protein